MSAKGAITTILATQIAEAVRLDELPEVGGFDLSAGMFGPNISKVIRDAAGMLSERLVGVLTEADKQTILQAAQVIDDESYDDLAVKLRTIARGIP